LLCAFALQLLCAFAFCFAFLLLHFTLPIALSFRSEAKEFTVPGPLSNSEAKDFSAEEAVKKREGHRVSVLLHTVWSWSEQ